MTDNMHTKPFWYKSEAWIWLGATATREVLESNLKHGYWHAASVPSSGSTMGA